MKLFSFLLAFFVITVPFISLAQATQSSPFVVCDGADCNLDKFFELVTKTINFFMTAIFVPVAVLAFAWAGLQMVISRDKPGAYSKAKHMFEMIFWGAVWVLAGWLVIKLILDSIYFNDSGEFNLVNFLR